MLSHFDQDEGNFMFKNEKRNAHISSIHPLYALTVAIDKLWEKSDELKSRKKVRRCAVCNDSGKATM